MTVDNHVLLILLPPLILPACWLYLSAFLPRLSVSYTQLIVHYTP